MTTIYRFKLAGLVRNKTLPGVVADNVRYCNVDWTMVSVDLNQNDLLVVLRKFDLTEDNFLNDKYQWTTVVPNKPADMVDLATGFCGSGNYRKALQMLRLTGKIPGFVVLVQNKPVWISLFDIKRLELVVKDVKDDKYENQMAC